MRQHLANESGSRWRKRRKWRRRLHANMAAAMRGIAARQYGESAEERPLSPPLGVAAARQAGESIDSGVSWRHRQWRHGVMQCGGSAPLSWRHLARNGKAMVSAALA
jgi:hypothetical protein